MREQPYTEAEIQRFRAAVPLGQRARVSFEIGLGTGLRLLDIARVPADEMRSRHITILTNKTGAAVTVPVTKNMLDARGTAGGGCRSYPNNSASFVR